MRAVDFVLMWHMHQPDYRDQASGEFALPWVYLHAMKDYTDMAWHLEQHPDMRAVVNFAPVLLDQLEDYAQQFACGQLRDPLLRLLAHDESAPLTAAERNYALDRCFRANHHKMIAPFAAYKQIHDLFRTLEAQGEAGLAYLSDQYIYDLLMWYHLSWTGETLRREQPAIARLMAVANGYTRATRLELLGLIGGWISEVVPRYRKLAAAGRIEVSTTPHYHPLAPLLLDFRAAHDTLPDAPLPTAPEYPGGRDRVNVHLNAAIESHARRFGMPPQGLWPAEGALSDSFLRVVDEKSLSWIASSESVLANSLRKTAGRVFERGRDLYRPYRVASVSPRLTCFFRDERLSDLIGFSYAKWHGSDAAANFVNEVEAAAAAAPQGERPLVCVILDGENAWEYYPYNAYYFLSGLYSRLEAHATIRTHTFASYLAANAAGAAVASGELPAVAPGELPAVAAGSWVYGNLSTWIGSAEKNHAWDLLAAAKQCFDLVIASGRLAPAEEAAVRRQLADCEGSDWFWWFGDYNPAEAVSSFDHLFRAKLSNLYRLMQLPLPQALHEPISRGGGHPESGGAMRRAS